MRSMVIRFVQLAIYIHSVTYSILLCSLIIIASADDKVPDKFFNSLPGLRASECACFTYGEDQLAPTTFVQEPGSDKINQKKKSNLTDVGVDRWNIN